MFKKINSDIFLIVHFFMGMGAGFFPALVYYWAFGTFILGIYLVLTTGDQYRTAQKYAAYLVGMELLSRMSQSGIPHEFTKYAVIALLTISIFSHKQKISYLFTIYFFLQVPGILMVEGKTMEVVRQIISANISGPLCLAVCAIYFFRRPLNHMELRQILLLICYPIAAILGFLFINTPDLNKIEFGFQSNYETSLYGPNQMSSILGLGILLVAYSFYLHIRLFRSNILTFIFLAVLTFRGLLTFSRGGMIIPAILIMTGFLYVLVNSISYQKYLYRIGFFVIMTISTAYLSFNYVNDLTNNALQERYSGKVKGKQLKIDRFTSGRSLILAEDIAIFRDHPVLGVGLGMAKYHRADYGYSSVVAAHIEFSRLLAEHGILGLFALLILLSYPVIYFIKASNRHERILIIGCVGFCFGFMSHAATRIAAPCFLYGMAFSSVVPVALGKKR